jgi:hypothetical protein
LNTKLVLQYHQICAKNHGAASPTQPPAGNVFFPKPVDRTASNRFTRLGENTLGRAKANTGSRSNDLNNSVTFDDKIGFAVRESPALAK